ncbi:MAG: hypothetical protein A2144_10915, partial [Chloroflexi bacterium RBG_16_50_9]
QFSPQQANLAFKTDDVIPYSRMVELDYYNSFLRPQNLLGELIIRLYSGDNTFGAISLQRYQEHSCFEKKDVLKASLLVPYLVNIFETAYRLVKTNDERMLLERWMDSYAEGVVLLDTGLQPIFINSMAKRYFSQMNTSGGDTSIDTVNLDTIIPKIIVQDCKNLMDVDAPNCEPDCHGNRIINTKHNQRYYAQYFFNYLSSSQRTMPHFIVFLNELNTDFEGEGISFSGQHRLSRREEIIARHAAGGFTNKQIADKLCISPFTVQNHLKSIFEKTGLNSRTKLANLVKYLDMPLD